MSRNETMGKMITCSRCDRDDNFVFLKYIRHIPMDGGYSPGYNEFEELPKEWLYESEFGYLCPECASEFRRFMTDFFGEDKVISKWKFKPE